MLNDYVIEKLSKLTGTTISTKKILNEDEIDNYLDNLSCAFYLTEYKEELDYNDKSFLHPVLEYDSLIYQLKSFYYNTYIVLILTPIDL